MLPATDSTTLPAAPSRRLLAVDSGGTKCEALLTALDGTPLGWGRCDVRSPHSGRGVVGSGRTLASIAAAARDALQGTVCDELVLVGVGTEALVNCNALCATPGGCRITVTRMEEFEPAFSLAGVDSGVVLLAGTGAFAHARTRDGRSLHLDGLGPLLGDYGGGFYIGLRALQAAVKSSWHPRHQTAITAALAAATGHDALTLEGQHRLSSFFDLGRDRAEISNLAPLVFEVAAAGDRVAAAILDQAAAALTATLEDLLARLDIADESYPLLGIGGLIQHHPAYWERICAAVRRIAPKLQPRRLAIPPVYGLALGTLIRQRAIPEAVLRRNLLTAPTPLAGTPPVTNPGTTP